ncbi:hypothetical protein GRI34_05335 [Erythrobacter aquimaris]|uniref:Uncharacterized protein n=1 Tax=Qipengyuania aquimaris TaxID=255984 RepID=A0A6I4TIY6_9SPHN|nr:hypothetical protein [Qipengyuania aquimaris]MXO95844.1 hypothetical protein [Qipengyuania aquimaris]
MDQDPHTAGTALAEGRIRQGQAVTGLEETVFLLLENVQWGLGRGLFCLCEYRNRKARRQGEGDGVTERA